MNDIEKIKAKIKRLMKETDASQFGIGGRCMCRIILDFIDSMSEEKPSEDLEKEVKRYYSDNFTYISSDQPTLSILTNVARHFVEWGAKHLK